MKNITRTKKLTLAGLLSAVGVAGSLFSVPVFGSKCAPVQHMVKCRKSIVRQIVKCVSLLYSIWG